MAVVCPICKSSAQEVPHTGDATDQRRRLQSCGWDYEPRLYDGGRGSPGTLGHPFGGPLFVSSSGFIRCNSIEIPFKLSIRTFHVSITAITAAIASYKVRHPSW